MNWNGPSFKGVESISEAKRHKRAKSNLSVYLLLVGMGSVNCGGRRSVLAFDLGLGGQKLIAPGFAKTFGTFIDCIPHAEAVVARAALVAGKLSAFRAGIERCLLRAAVLFVELMLANDAHGCLLSKAGEYTMGVYRQ
jgi:hypothetical protein